MASDLRDDLHAAHGPLYQNARLEKAGSHDPRGLYSEDRADRLDVLAVSHMWEPGVSVSIRLVYTDAEGQYRAYACG